MTAWWRRGGDRATRSGVERVAWVTGTFVLVLLVGIGSGFVLHAFVGTGPTTFDRGVTDWFVDQRTPTRTDTVLAIQGAGRSSVLVALAVVGLALMFSPAFRPLGGFLVVVGIGAQVLINIAKPVVGRIRPPHSLQLEPIVTGAFPSGHAIITTVVAAATAVAIGQARRRRLPPIAWVGAAVFTGCVGVSRVYLGVHWITDVVGGWALGFAWVLLLARVWFPHRADENGDYVVTSSP